jgi:O-antigen/teichoic acid export membrane protein
MTKSVAARHEVAATDEASPGYSTGALTPKALRRIAVRGGAALLGSRLFSQTFAWVVTILVARALRPYDYGVVAAGGILYGFAEIMAEAGIGRAVIQKPTLSRRDLDEAFTLSLAVALVFYGLVFALAAPSAIALRNPDQVLYLRVNGLFLLLMPIRSIPMGILNRRLELGRLSALGAVCSVVQGLVVLGCAWAGFGYWSFVASFAVAALLEVATLVALTGWRPRLYWPRHGINPLTIFGLQLSGARLCVFLYSNSDYAVVGRLLGPEQLGYYSLAFLVISMPLQKLVANLGGVAYPVFCRMSHDRERLANWFFRLTVLVGSIGTPALIGLALVANDAFPLLLGQKWIPAVVPLQLMCVAGVFMMIGGMFDGLFNALGRPDILFRYNLACAFVFPPCFWVAGLMLGTVGVALAWSLVCPLMVLSLVILTRQITNFGPGQLLRGQGPVWSACVLMAMAVMGVKYLLTPIDFVALRLAASIAAGVISYVAAIRLLAWDSVAGNLKMLWKEYAR